MSISIAPAEAVRTAQSFMDGVTALQSFIDWAALQARDYPEDQLEAPTHSVRGKDEKRIIVAGRGRAR